MGPIGSRTKALGVLALACGIAGAQPALAQFSSQEGFAPDGAPQWRFEIQPFLWLPATHAKIGLGRVPQIDPSFDLPRPTILNLIEGLKGAFSCNCLARYGNWSGEVNVIYVSVDATKPIAPVSPGGAGATLNSDLSVFMIAPGFGYRILHGAKVSMDARAGFSYNAVSADATYAGSRFAGTAAPATNFIQPWIGERLDYYPTPRWRLENAFSLTGLGVDGGAIGWRGQAGVTYLVARWFDVSAGYSASQTFRNRTAGPNGENNTLNLLQYGPYLVVGFRF